MKHYCYASFLIKLLVMQIGVHSGHLYSDPSSHLLLRGAPDYSTDTVSEFHANAHRQLQVHVRGLPKAKAGVELTTLRLKVIVSTKAPPTQTGINNLEGALYI